jgi:predicted nuclease of restriction endonuclease-like (RecB) superfamily
MSELEPTSDDALYERIASILDDARRQVARTVNTAMVHAYWHVGREIVEVEQAGAERAAYGEQLIERLAVRLSKRFGRGMGAGTLRRARAFHLTYPRGSCIPRDSRDFSWPSVTQFTGGEIRSAALTESNGPLFPPLLAWSHYLTLLRVSSPDARAFYEIEAARESWSVRELERQIGALLFERLSRHKSPEQVRELALRGQQGSTAEDVLKDPFVLEFVDLRENAGHHERDLEQGIIDRLEAFLLEMGRGFCFVGRQKRLTIDGDHFYVDLVFYNRLLRCFVLVDLKLGKLTHQDLGQMQMYVNWYDQTQRAEHETRTIGIVLCSDKNDAMVKITLPEDNEQVVAARYRMYLPSEDELRNELERERDETERRLRLDDPPA